MEICADEVPQSVILAKEPDRISGELVLCFNETRVEYSDITLTNNDTGKTNSFDTCILGVKENTEQVLANVN